MLGVPGEVTWPVPALTIPNLWGDPLSGEEIVQRLDEFEGVRLFVERAKAVQPSFELTPANASLIAKICWNLDGIALAIELAAARVKILSLEQIDEHLNDRFHLLAAVCHLAAGDCEGVMDACQRAAVDPALATECAYLMGWAALLRKDPGTAALTLRRVAESKDSPSAGHAQALLAGVRFYQGDFEEAVQWWKAMDPARRAARWSELRVAHRQQGRGPRLSGWETPGEDRTGGGVANGVGIG